MNLFNWTHSREMQAEQLRRNAAAEYAEALVSWQLNHGTDTHDFTPEQRERLSLFVRAANAGVDFLTIAFWQHRVRSGGWQR